MTHGIFFLKKTSANNKSKHVYESWWQFEEYKFKQKWQLILRRKNTNKVKKISTK